MLPWDTWWKAMGTTKNQVVHPWVYGNEQLPADAKIDKAYKFDRTQIVQSRQCEADVLQLRTSHLVKIRMITTKS